MGSNIGTYAISPFKFKEPLDANLPPIKIFPLPTKTPKKLNLPVLKKMVTLVILTVKSQRIL